MSNAMAETDQSCTELDFPTNMPVVGRHSYSILDHMREVALCIPLVDSVIQYDSPYDGLQYQLVI